MFNFRIDGIQNFQFHFLFNAGKGGGGLIKKNKTTAFSHSVTLLHKNKLHEGNKSKRDNRTKT